MIELAHRLVLIGEHDAAISVLDGLAHHSRITLSLQDREAILPELENPPPGLGQLRAVLLQEHVRWEQEGLLET